jgi:hypothetical protein
MGLLREWEVDRLPTYRTELLSKATDCLQVKNVAFGKLSQKAPRLYCCSHRPVDGFPTSESCALRMREIQVVTPFIQR